MAKVKIHVAKPFKLLTEKGEPMHFGVGNHTVDQAVADHWFVKAHLDGESAGGDTEAAADELLAELEAKAKAVQEAEATLAAREAEVAEREKAVAAREQALDAAKQEAEAKAKAEAEAKPAAKTSK